MNFTRSITTNRSRSNLATSRYSTMRNAKMRVNSRRGFNTISTRSVETPKHSRWNNRDIRRILSCVTLDLIACWNPIEANPDAKRHRERGNNSCTRNKRDAREDAWHVMIMRGYQQSVDGCVFLPFAWLRFLAQRSFRDVIRYRYRIPPLHIFRNRQKIKFSNDTCKMRFYVASVH